ISNWYIEGGNGYETLSEAYAAASSGDVIYAKAGTYDLNGITISKAITIKANESGAVILNGNGNQIFNIKSNVVLDNLTFINGSSSSNGGLIYLSSGYSLVINNSVFRDSQATSGQGSAIYAASGALNVIIENSAFENIKAAAALINCRSSSSVFTVIKSNFTNINVSSNGIFYFYEGGINAIDSQFINISGAEGAVAYFWGLNNNNFTKCIFDNVTTSSNGIIYSNGRTVNVGYSIFANVNKALYSSSTSGITAVYNFFGTNDKANTTMVNSYTKNYNWTIVSLSSQSDTLYSGTNNMITLDFSKFTDGTAIYALPDSMPDYTFDLTATAGTVDSSVTVENGLATANYLAPNEEMNEVTITANPSGAELKFAIMDTSSLIVVATDGSNTDGLGTMDSPYQTIA
ncbi:hypothetical protein, partial [uncultured Methanobrevibacter sp.]|uniref:hypothetical protein n=1 Tax=uncultured Methanobrevibacter sp. TaxID=253161 RepID=UPI002616C5ED